MNTWSGIFSLVRKLCRRDFVYQAVSCQAMSTRKVKVGVCQMTSGTEKAENLVQGQRLIDDCVKQNAQVHENIMCRR